MAVIGLGTMGAGTVEVFARAGLAVTAIEVVPERMDIRRHHAIASLAFHPAGSGQ